jgi:hypothetical protein
MARNINELICYADEGNPDLDTVRIAIEWLGDKPEVLEVLEKAYSLQGKPLTIRLAPSGANIVHYDYAVHEIAISPDFQQSIKSNNGKTIVVGLERVLAHEILHSSQQDEGKYEEAQDLLEAIAFKYLIEPSREKFQQRIAAARTETQLMRVFEDFFDSEIAPIISLRLEQMKAEIRQSVPIQRFFLEIEHPAIEFENLVMGKYRGEAPANVDYMDSIGASDREQYVAHEVKQELHNRSVNATIASWGLDKNGNEPSARR